MKSLLEHSCESVFLELKNLVYVYELKTEDSKSRFRKKKPVVCFDVRELPSSKTPGVNQLHLICFIQDYPESFMYLAEVDPTTRRWTIESSSFFEKTKKFMYHCLEILECRDPKNAHDAGQMLKEIADKEFNKLFLKD